MNWRIINDRRPIIARCCDKLEMKELARERVPDAGLLRIPDTLWSGTDLREIGALPSHGNWVLKPNHSSGAVIIGPADLEAAVMASTGWLRSRPAEQLAEWGYSQARSLLVLEERIGTGAVPTDYKFFCYDGEPRFAFVVEDRFSRPAARFYDTQWKPVGSRLGLPVASVEEPERLQDMLALCRRLSAGFDFMRVDLYCVDGQIWFGEFSPYPHGGLMLFRPRDLDTVLGAPWSLPTREQVAFEAPQPSEQPPGARHD